MTDKTPKKMAETVVNTQATLADTTDTAREGEPKSRALPQANALKERFKAGSIPLQTDFADLIDLANMGRQAVGGAEGQTGPANGFTLSSEGRLELKPNAAKGIVVDKDGIAVKPETNKGLQVTASGVSVLAGNGVALTSSGVNVKLANGTASVTTGNAGGLTLDTAGLSVRAGNGISVTSTGVAVKPETNKGLQVTASGVSVLAGNGVALTSSGVNVKLANGTASVTTGNAGGLTLDTAGLSVRAGNGISVTSTGVAVKPETNKGLQVTASGVSVLAGNGISVTSTGVAVKPDTKLGLQVTSNGVGLNNTAWIKMMCGFHSASFYVNSTHFSVFFCNYSNGCVAYVYGRGAFYLSTVNVHSALNSVSPNQILAMTGGSSSAATMMSWTSTKAAEGVSFKYLRKTLINSDNYTGSILLVAAP